jgi:hypothetical protein
MIRNRRLPDWLHRLCDAVLGFFLVAALSLAGVRLLPDRWQGTGFVAAIGLTAFAAILLAAVDPKRFSIVGGVAGDAGYDDLREDDGKTRVTNNEGNK